MLIASVDWSLNGPGICVYENTKPFNWDNVNIYFLTKTQKYVINNDTLHGQLLQEQPDDFHRWEYLKMWAFDKLEKCKFVIIENYSYGSRGRAIFNISESTGILKQCLWLHNIQIEVVPPSAAKKHFTGKGNADKSLIYSSFVDKTGINLVKMFDYQKAKIDSPLADICDAFSIMDYAIEHYDFLHPE